MRERTMRHILRRTSLLLVPFTLAALVVGTPTAAPDTGLQNVALACSDGTNIGLTLSTTAVTNLTNATTAMTLFPAGLSCAVSTQSNPPPGGNPQRDYAVGGGDQFFTQPQLEAPCKINFGFSAYTPSNSPTSAKGTFTETVPGGCVGLGFTGELRVAINCLDVNMNLADMSGTVTKATGQFATGAEGFVAGGTAYISAGDFGGPAMDLLGASKFPTGDSPDCHGTANQAATSNGNINVHDAG
jgi:hypothetical protein